MLVKDVMIDNVVRVSPFATVREAMRLMKTHEVDSLVVDKRHAHDAYAMITYTDILRAIVAEEGDIDLINVYDICTKPALAISREWEVKHAARLMAKLGIRRVLVTANNELVGIITMNDIVDAILDQLGEGP
ncbi:MAG: CBS domain-containing protein [Chromatiaceae bacterium]|jgi:signal-transduction protein with cAMP-binding, CBS, and nucleotidyltransferase domain|nr:CBS domain-containing protein [Chromatiaceae bacterium]